MQPAFWEGPVRFLCAWWWVIVLLIVLAVSAYIFRDYWMPLVGL